MNLHLPRVAPFYLSGAHWSMADPCFAVERRLMHRKPRMSKRNLAMGWGTQYHHTSEEEIRAELARHRDDPLLF